LKHLENTATQSRKNQRQGATAEEIVLKEILDRGHYGKIQNTKKVYKGGRWFFTKKQDCDIIGHLNGMNQAPLYVEVKSEKSPLKLFQATNGLRKDQIDFLMDRWKEGCVSLLAWVDMKNNKILYCEISRIFDLAKFNDQHSITWDQALSLRKILIKAIYR